MRNTLLWLNLKSGYKSHVTWCQTWKGWLGNFHCSIRTFRTLYIKRNEKRASGSFRKKINFVMHHHHASVQLDFTIGWICISNVVWLMLELCIRLAVSAVVLLGVYSNKYIYLYIHIERGMISRRIGGRKLIRSSICRRWLMEYSRGESWINLSECTKGILAQRSDEEFPWSQGH